MLYFVGTPIGNMSDISKRAIETLSSVDLICCEDTRHSLKLLNFYSIKKQLISFHKFNETKEVENIISLLNEGKNIAVISDAGMPIISDPGNILSKTLRERGINYTVIPSGTAFVSALILSGLNAEKFAFIGFLPEKKIAREKLLNAKKSYEETLIFYSAPHDVNKDLKELYDAFGDRRVAVVKEITKIHESVYLSTLKNAQIDEPKGEFVIVVEGNQSQGEQDDKFSLLSIEEHINLYISRGMSKKDALKQVAKERGISKNELYKYTIN